MNNLDFLTGLLKTIQRSQTEMRGILDFLMGSSLRITIQTQLKEFEKIETETLAIAQQRGWELKALDPFMRFMADRIIRFKLSRRNSDSRIAEIMIRNNTKDMIYTLKNLHQYRGQDSRVCILSQKLLDCATAYIRQMQRYL